MVGVAAAVVDHRLPDVLGQRLDVLEDLADALARIESDPAATQRLAALVRFEAERAQEWF